jgi:hypothetical protein
MTRPSEERPSERGVALILVLLSMVLLSALAAALLLVIGTETLVAAHHRDAAEALYAADAALERALADIIPAGDWNRLLASPDGLRAETPSAFSGGALVFPSSGGPAIDLARETSALNCPQAVPRPAVCADAQMDAIIIQRPWGANNPRFRLYAWGALGSLARPSVDSPFVVAVWVADDPAEVDGDPSRDGSGDGSAGAGVIQVRASSFGPGGVRSSVVATVSRTGGDSAAHGYTAQRGDDERGQRRHQTGVQSPGGAVARGEVDVSGQQRLEP